MGASSWNVSLGGLAFGPYKPKFLIKGLQPALLGGGGGVAGGSGMVGGQPRATSRYTIRNAMNSLSYWKGIGSIPSPLPRGYGSATTPFRVVMNAGDPLGSRQSGPNPYFPLTSQLSGGFRTLPNAKRDGVHSGEAGYSGNPNFVYDSSVYTTYKSLSAKRNNYNAYSFGGAGQDGMGNIGRINRKYTVYGKSNVF